MKRPEAANLSRLSRKQESKALSAPELKKLRGLLDKKNKKKLERDGRGKKKSKEASNAVACAASVTKLAVSPKPATKLADVDYCKVWRLTVQQLRILITFDDDSTVAFKYVTEAELLRDFEAWIRLHSPGKN